jgi:hypothetical protein
MICISCQSLNATKCPDCELVTHCNVCRTIRKTHVCKHNVLPDTAIQVNYDERLESMRCEFEQKNIMQQFVDEQNIVAKLQAQFQTDFDKLKQSYENALDDMRSSYATDMGLMDKRNTLNEKTIKDMLERPNNITTDDIVTDDTKVIVSKIQSNCKIIKDLNKRSKKKKVEDKYARLSKGIKRPE